jgi:hypothetical protein
MTGIGQDGASSFRQTERFIQFTKRKQARVARDLRSVEFELEFSIKLNTKCLFSPVTQWMPLSKWPETLALQGKHARIMPLRSIHLGNPGLAGGIGEKHHQTRQQNNVDGIGGVEAGRVATGSVLCRVVQEDIAGD